MSNALDSCKQEKDSAKEAREFVTAILVYPINYEFSLWNLQGDWGMRMSCKRRGKVPAELEFKQEIELAKELGWLDERPEDVDFTERYQEIYKERPIGYGRMFVRAAKSSLIRQQTSRFVHMFTKRATGESHA